MGLRLRLVLVLMVPLILVVGLYGYVRIRQEQTQLLAEQERDVALTARAVQIAVENALRDRQIADIERLLAEMVEHQEAIDRIRLFDKRFVPVLVSNPLSIGEDVPLEALGQAVATGTPQAVYQSRRGRPVLYYVMPIRDRHGQTAGAMELVHLATRVHERVREANRDVVVRLTLLVASIAALAGVMLQRQVLRPLARLMDGIRGLGRGEPGPPLPVQRRDELGRVAEAFNEMAEHLETARRQLLTETGRALDLERQLRQAAMLAVAGKLASGIAHEVGTPLNIISGRAEFLLKTAPLRSPERRDLEIIVRQIERISKIIHGLLDSVRAQKPEIRSVAVHDFVEEFFPLLRDAARRRGVALTASMPEAVPPMLADPAQLQQVVLNLVLNALDATPAGGRVSIAARPHQRNGHAGVAVSVADSGSGIPAEQHAQIFEPFFTTKPRGKGTGLGLAICRDIVRAHGGDIEVASQAGAGTTFTFWIPSVGEPWT